MVVFFPPCFDFLFSFLVGTCKRFYAILIVSNESGLFFLWLVGRHLHLNMILDWFAQLPFQKCEQKPPGNISVGYKCKCEMFREEDYMFLLGDRQTQIRCGHFKQNIHTVNILKDLGQETCFSSEARALFELDLRRLHQTHIHLHFIIFSGFAVEHRHSYVFWLQPHIPRILIYLQFIFVLLFDLLSMSQWTSHTVAHD